MTLTAYILLMVVSVLINPSTKEEATKAKVLELAKTSLEQYLDMDVYAFIFVCILAQGYGMIIFTIAFIHRVQFA